MSERDIWCELLKELDLTFWLVLGVTLSPQKEGKVPTIRYLLICQHNQEGVDLMIPIMHKNKNDIGAIIIQVKNYKDKQSKNTMRRKAGPPLSPEIVFTEELEKSYVEEPFIQPCFYDEKKIIFDTDPSRTITTHSWSTFELPENKLYN
ncbi:10912_t:CDS:2 [Entrophospora sp. SA101]|nr:10912_t:CDS:2 [Entrophospora sp. SA101]